MIKPIIQDINNSDKTGEIHSSRVDKRPIHRKNQNSCQEHEENFACIKGLLNTTQTAGMSHYT